MIEEEFFRRWDAREAELNRRMLSVDEHMRRGNAIMERSDETLRDSNEIHRDTRTFIRGMTLRMQAYMDGLTQEMSAYTRRIEANTDVLIDLRLATSQHTQALARMLDRLG